MLLGFFWRLGVEEESGVVEVRRVGGRLEDDGWGSMEKS